MRAGAKKHRVSFERQADTVDSVGQRTRTWTELASRLVSIEPLNGREYFQASGYQSEVTTRIRATYETALSTLTSDDRITHGSVTYEIVSVINPQERNRELVLMCKRSG